MVCYTTTSNTAGNTNKLSVKAKGCKKARRTSPASTKFAGEMKALRSLVPKAKTEDLGDVELVLEAISYIRQLEAKLRLHSTPDLLKAQYLTMERMAAKQCEF